MKFSSLAALEVVKMTTSSAASDENFVKMTALLFQFRSFLLSRPLPPVGIVLLIITNPAKLASAWFMADEKVGGPVKNMRGPLKFQYVTMFEILKSCQKCFSMKSVCSFCYESALVYIDYCSIN